MSITVYNPTSGPTAEKTFLAPRLSSLIGCKMGVIDNGKFQSDVVLNRIVEALDSRFGISEVIAVRKHSVSHGVKEEDARMLARKCHFVLAGIGD